MRRKSLFVSFAAVTVLFLSHTVASAQVGQLRGQVTLKQADGQTVPAAGAQIDVYRTDLPGTYNTKTDKKGSFVFAGLPYVGTYIISASAPNAQPKVVPDVKAGRETEYSVVLDPGDGKRLTKEEARLYSGGSGSPAAGGGGESAEDRGKREELIRKNAEIEAKNKKIVESNEVVGRTFKAGNEALMAKRYDEAITQYNEGIAADPAQSALLTNKALAHKARGVDRYNAAVKNTDEAARKSELEAARTDFREAAEASKKAVDLLKAQPAAAADPAEQTRQSGNKLAAFSVHAESMRLFVTKVDQSQADAGLVAYQDYLAVETDPAKKSKGQLDSAQMLFDAGAPDKALAEFQKILTATPDDVDANLGAGLALYGTGDKAKYQEAANYLQRFVDKAPDTHKLKQDAKAVLEELKNAENIKPQRTTPARRRG